MSDSITILFFEKFPGPAKVQSVIAGLGFALSLGDAKQSFEDASGFWPMTLAIKSVEVSLGVEVYIESPAAFLSQRRLRADPRFRCGLRFRWGASLESLFGASVVCAAFARICECAVYDEHHDARLSEQELNDLLDCASNIHKKMEHFYLIESDEWLAQFLALLRRRNSQYEVNRRAIWPDAELYVDQDGVFWQQSTNTSMEVLGPLRFSHCFAVSVHLSDTKLLGPFTIGGRCSGGYTIADAFEHDIGAAIHGPTRIRGLQSTHTRRRGYEEIVDACTANAEEHLAPAYMRQLAAAARTLLKCIEVVEKMPSLLHDDVRRRFYGKQLGTDHIGATAIARPNALLRGLGSAAPEAIGSLNGAYLSKYRDELPDVATRLEKLAGMVSNQ